MAEAGPAGWEARLALRFEQRAGRTVLARRSHEGPLAVQKPFYPEGDVCHVYLLHPPGGMVGGDRLAIEIEVASNAHALITTPAAGKFYRSGGPASMQEQLLSVAPGAVLEWLPQETILYARCRASLSTRVTLNPGARFIGWEILCLGRPAAGERFDAGVCRQRLELWCDDRPLLIERNTIAGGSELLQAPWGFGGHPISGTFLATPADPTTLDAVRQAVAVEGEDLFSATLLDSVLLCRYLGDSAGSARRCFIDAWGSVRPALLGREAHLPRIWST
ncbi:MAG: urease accessory protein UreD [Gammaproteobacteria bacterium]